MAQTWHNGDSTVLTIPQAFADLTGSVAGNQLPGTPTGSGNIVMASSPTINSPTLVSPVLGTPASGALTNCTFPTLNQNTTGTAGGITGAPAITVAVVTCSGVTNSGISANKRVTVHAGTALASTDFAASSGWGTSPTITVNRGTDQAASVSITAKATVAANPTLTLTFHDGTWTQVPVVVACRGDITAATGTPSASVSNEWAVTSTTATAVIFTFNGTPVANSSYTLNFIAMGT